jgi:hypothetical protein
MSEFYVKKFNQEHVCAHCKAARMRVGKKVYSICELHLTLARDKWRLWATTRRGLGRCISCDCKSFRGWLRCKKHTEINRRRCENWYKARVVEDPGYGNRKYTERYNTYTAKGLCISCAEHTPLVDGFHRCESCRARYNHRTQRRKAHY